MVGAVASGEGMVTKRLGEIGGASTLEELPVNPEEKVIVEPINSVLRLREPGWKGECEGRMNVGTAR